MTPRISTQHYRRHSLWAPPQTQIKRRVKGILEVKIFDIVQIRKIRHQFKVKIGSEEENHFLVLLVFYLLIYFWFAKGKKEKKKYIVRGEKDNGKCDYTPKGTYYWTPADSVRKNKLHTKEKKNKSL